jgi:hypothetical protein
VEVFLFSPNGERLKQYLNDRQSTSRTKNRYHFHPMEDIRKALGRLEENVLVYVDVSGMNDDADRIFRYLSRKEKVFLAFSIPREQRTT